MDKGIACMAFTGNIHKDCRFTKKNRWSRGVDTTAYLDRSRRTTKLGGYYDCSAEHGECKSISIEDYNKDDGGCDD